MKEFQKNFREIQFIYVLFISHGVWNGGMEVFFFLERLALLYKIEKIKHLLQPKRKNICALSLPLTIYSLIFLRSKQFKVYIPVF